MELSEKQYDLLVAPESTRAERLKGDTPISSIPGPVLVPGLTSMCLECKNQIAHTRQPKMALANNLWLGEVPPVLRDLTLAEQTLISRVRYNRCIVRVSNGHAKMIANVVAFEHPTMKVYDCLPIALKDLDEVLAVVFTGINPPSEDDLKQTPVVVRRNRVRLALEWLKLNHKDYTDLTIDYSTLESYPLNNVPVKVLFNKMDEETPGNTVPSAQSQFDNEEEIGTASGPCPFTVHGLTVEKFETMTTTERKAAAIQHIKNGGRTLAVGHSANPESMYDNLALYPKMFPWLFRYGYGGIGQLEHQRMISRDTHIEWLLMYYDKRFQEDAGFLIVAFNHRLIKQGTFGSFLLVKRNNFMKVAQSIRTLNPVVLSSIAERMKHGMRVTPQTVQEKECFSLLDQIEYVGGHVNASVASKKFQRNELWSLLSFANSPNWFITLSFADNKHPLCIYFADHDVEFRPEIKGYAERQHLVTHNPVACARFFHYLVDLFLRHICGWHTDGECKGIFRTPSVYYGMVEQQGCMTLHLHMLLWIEGAPPLQEIRDRLMRGDSAFQQELLAYLESCHVGEFLTGTMEDVTSKVPKTMNPRSKGIHTILVENSGPKVPDGYQDPTLTMPIPPPGDFCDDEGCECPQCEDLALWYNTMQATTDDILLRSNVHKCFGWRDNNDSPGNKTSKQRPKPANKDRNRQYQINTRQVKAALIKMGFAPHVFPATST